ncbi:MAG TPA: hypothetical protein VGE11_00865 [Pseudonocardia sp.]
MQLPLPADVVPLVTGVFIAVVVVVALVVGLRTRADESPAPVDADGTGENEAVARPLAPQQPVVRRTVADAIADRQADTDPFPVVHRPTAVADANGSAALDAVDRAESPPTSSERPPAPGLDPSAGSDGPPEASTHQPAAKSGGAVVGVPAAQAAAADQPTGDVAAAEARDAAGAAPTEPGSSPAQPHLTNPKRFVAPGDAVAPTRPDTSHPAPDRIVAPGQPVAQAQPDRAPVGSPAPTSLAARVRAAAVDSATTPAASSTPTPAPWDRAAVQAPSTASDHPHPVPEDAAGLTRAGQANPISHARHAAAQLAPVDHGPADPTASDSTPAGDPHTGSTAPDAAEQPSAGATEPVDPTREGAIPHQSSNVTGSGRTVGTAIAHVLAARAAVPAPGPDRRGDARDRLLAAMLDDPRAAVGAVVDLQDCQERMRRLSGALHEERVRLRELLGKLTRSGLRADQLGRLSGLPDSEVAELLRAPG